MKCLLKKKNFTHSLICFIIQNIQYFVKIDSIKCKGLIYYYYIITGGFIWLTWQFTVIMKLNECTSTRTNILKTVIKYKQ